MAINTTGLYDPDELLLGRGILYASALDVNGLPTTWEDLGNAPQINVSATSEELSHRSARGGLKVIDKQVVISQDAVLNFQLDSVNFGNIARFLSGTTSTATVNAAVAGFTEYPMATSVVLGRWYDIQDANGLRAYDIETADLTVEKNGSPDVLLVEGTDYTVDLKFGRIFLLPGAVNIAAGDDMDVTLVADAGAVALAQVFALTQTNVQVALKFIGANPANNDKQYEAQFHKVTLKAEGDFALISDEFTVMGFTAAVERSSNPLHALSPFVTITDHANS